jgi:hypothetical protein
MGAIARGVSRVGHHDFMDTIWKAGKSRAVEVERIEADRLNTLDSSASSGHSTTCKLPSGIVSWYTAEDNADDAVGNNHRKNFFQGFQGLSSRFRAGESRRAYPVTVTGAAGTSQ